MSNRIFGIEHQIGMDPGGRNISRLILPGHLEAAAVSLLEGDRIVIVSGFYIPEAQAGETDGPPGAKALGEALKTLGKEVSYVTDRFNEAYFEALGMVPVIRYRKGILKRLNPSHLVSIERVGRASNGKYYNMRGVDISATTAPIDEMFIEAGKKDITTIGIGDGGNEIGMGKVLEDVNHAIPNGKQIACKVKTDFLIVSGVSNWGAYGLVAALSLLTEQNLLPDPDVVEDEIRILVSLGAVDGVTLKCAETVDGLPLSESLALLARLRELI